MYRVFFETTLGRYCVGTFDNEHKDEAIEYVKQKLSAGYDKIKEFIFCEILDDNNKVVWDFKPKRRSQAQRAADKRYADKHKGEYVNWGTTFRREEAVNFDKAIKSAGKSRAEFIREAVKNLEIKNGKID